MSRTPVEIGTLIVVILKARNLPNKKRIGKQDPYCTIRVNNETQRTKAINRGGQHPDWDEEFRFTLFGDIITSSGHEPQSHSIGMFNILGGTTMHLACFADSFREPDLIGDALVDFTVALAKGEVDEWFQLSYKGQYVGEVYLEFTFWSNEAPPNKNMPVGASRSSPYSQRQQPPFPPVPRLPPPPSGQAGLPPPPSFHHHYQQSQQPPLPHRGRARALPLPPSQHSHYDAPPPRLAQLPTWISPLSSSSYAPLVPTSSYNHNVEVVRTALVQAPAARLGIDSRSLLSVDIQESSELQPAVMPSEGDDASQYTSSMSSRSYNSPPQSYDPEHAEQLGRHNLQPITALQLSTPPQNGRSPEPSITDRNPSRASTWTIDTLASTPSNRTIVSPDWEPLPLPDDTIDGEDVGGYLPHDAPRLPEPSPISPVPQPSQLESLEDFPVWKTQIIATARLLMCDDFLACASAPAAPAEVQLASDYHNLSLYESTQEQIARHISASKCAAELVAKHIGPDLLDAVKPILEKDVHEAWELLEELEARAAHSKEQIILSEVVDTLADTRYQEGADMREHVVAVRAALDALKALGMEFNVSMKVMLLFSSLPRTSDWKKFKHNLLASANGNAPLTFDTVEAALLCHSGLA